MAKQDKMIKGREILWIISEHDKLQRTVGGLYSLSDLLSVRFSGDNLESFINSWEMILIELEDRDRPTDEVLKVILFEESSHCHALKTDIEKYERMDEDDADRSYDFLIKAIKRYINQKRLSENKRVH